MTTQTDEHCKTNNRKPDENVLADNLLGKVRFHPSSPIDGQPTHGLAIWASIARGAPFGTCSSCSRKHSFRIAVANFTFGSAPQCPATTGQTLAQARIENLATETLAQANKNNKQQPRSRMPLLQGCGSDLCRIRSPQAALFNLNAKHVLERSSKKIKARPRKPRKHNVLHPRR